jgi:CRISPR/Cas system-associated exonuclease Cas4 (RecB family)
MLKLSATSIVAYLTCPRKFWLTWTLGIRPSTDAEALVTGTRFHGAMQAWRDHDLDGLSDYLNATFTQGDDAAMQREVLMRQVLAYANVYAHEPLKILATERPFEFQLSNCLLIGKIDAICEYRGLIYAVENKTTSSDIQSEDYWSGWTRNFQASIYAFALRRIFGSKAGGVLVDVIRKPTIKPKLLSTKKDNDGSRESPEQYGDRLSADMQTRPEFYFGRREVGRTTSDLEQTLRNIELIADAILWADRQEPPANFLSCDDPYPCAYKSICHDRSFPANLAELGPGFTRRSA